MKKKEAEVARNLKECEQIRANLEEREARLEESEKKLENEMAHIKSNMQTNRPFGGLYAGEFINVSTVAPSDMVNTIVLKSGMGRVYFRGFYRGGIRYIIGDSVLLPSEGGPDYVGMLSKVYCDFKGDMSAKDF